MSHLFLVFNSKVGRVPIHGIIALVGAVAAARPGRDGGSLLDVAGLLKAGTVVFRVDGGQQVDDEGEDVKGEDEGDDPFEDGGDVGVMGEGGAGEGDGEDELDKDKGELYPEGGAEDAVLAVL